MKVSLELLYHFNCDRCRKWWSCADIKPVVGSEVHCPHCGKVNVIESIKAHEVE